MVEEVEVRRRVITLKHNLMEAAGDETPDADAPATGTNGETHGAAPQLPWEISLPAIGNGHSESTACVCHIGRRNPHFGARRVLGLRPVPPEALSGFLIATTSVA